MDLSTLLDHAVLGIPMQRWLLAAGLASLVFLALRLARRYAVSSIGRLARRTATDWDDLIIHAIGKTRGLVLAVVALYAGMSVIEMPDEAKRTLGSVTTVALMLQGGLWLHAGVNFWFSHYRQREGIDGASATVVSALAFLSKLALWSIVLLVALDNLGIQVTAFVTGLGVGGIAIALALQNILGDLFASLSIVLDRPFVIGDFISVGELMGSVERVGLKTTRVRSLSGEQLIFANNDLLSSRIRNFGRMYERRVPFTLGVVYQTPRAKLTRIPGIIREAVEAQERTRFDRSHFKSYGAYSIDFETVFYVLGPDYNLYMDILQAINLHIHAAFEREGIDFAYPTQTHFIVQEAAS